MNLKHSKLKKKIIRFLNDMQWAFDYQNFDRVINFEKNEHPKKEVVCEVINQWEYRRVIIKIYPSFFEADAEQQRGYLLHEFCHSYTDMLYDMALDLLNGKLHTHEQIRLRNEEATSRITNVIESFLLGKMKYAKDGYARYLQPKR